MSEESIQNPSMPEDTRPANVPLGHVVPNIKRMPHGLGHGAVMVKSFHCRLTGDALEYVDDMINTWLEDNPSYEVKFVTTAVGEWSHKSSKEPNLVVQVWV